jgi:selT/selW/selH-like putative selenoprotein
VFEVTVDGARVFSKLETHRFPEEGEVVQAIRGS